MRKRRSAKLPSKYVGNMPLDHASRRTATHLLGRYSVKNIGKRKRGERGDGERELRVEREKERYTYRFLQIASARKAKLLWYLNISSISSYRDFERFRKERRKK